MKFAIINGAKSAEVVADYLPSKYNVVHVDPNGQGVLIAGEDDHGWTMDEYVLPRLASGLMPGKEVWPVFCAEHAGPAMDVPFDWIRMPLHRSAS